MENWKILLIVLLAAVVLGCVAGVVIGKYQVKKKNSAYKPLLSAKERLVYSLCLLLGVACIVFGLLYRSATQQAEEQPGGMIGMGESQGGDLPVEEYPAAGGYGEVVVIG